MKKTFLLCDDNDENLYVAQMVRTDEEITSEMQQLEVGSILNCDDGKYWIRSK